MPPTSVDGVLDGVPGLELLRERVELGELGIPDGRDELGAGTGWPDADVGFGEEEETGLDFFESR